MLIVLNRHRFYFYFILYCSILFCFVLFSDCFFVFFLRLYSGQVCITEFPSMLGGVTGLGNIGTENGILLSYMNDNLNTHIKLEEDEYIDAVLSDKTVNEIVNFGELRHSVRASLLDGYFTMIDSVNNNGASCYYFDLAWNCDVNSQFFDTYDEIATPMHVVSDSLFSNVCCTNE